MKPVSDGGKKDSRRQPLNRKEADMNMSVFHENCRRRREEGLEPMTPEEREEFLRPRTTHSNTQALDRCDKTMELDLQQGGE